MLYLKMKEIGSIFPLYDHDLKLTKKFNFFSESEQILYYSLCREALYDIARYKKESNSIKTVLIPAYTCQTVFLPFEKAGWKVEFFSVNRNLRINLEDLWGKIKMFNPSMIVVHPYFGMDLNEEEISFLENIKNKGIDIIIDLTQCIFSKKNYSFSTAITGSCRKWFPIPDGGFLKTSLNIQQPLEEFTDFTDYNSAAMYLRGRYFLEEIPILKTVSIKLNKYANFIGAENFQPHSISQLSYNLMKKENFDYIEKRRLNNFQYLNCNISETEKISKVCKDLKEVTTAPLYFNLYVYNRSDFQSYLAQNSVYAPIIWPVKDEKVLIDDNIRYIYQNILSIPCDQRYTEEDMELIASLVNNYQR